MHVCAKDNRGRGRARRGARRLALAAGLATGLAAGLLAAPARAQVDPADVTGRDFAGLRLPVQVGRGELELRAARAWTWVEPTGEGPGVRRALLRGDVRVRVGMYDFSAARAAVWLEPLSATDPAAPADSYQFFIHFDRVSTPEAGAGAAVTADRLPVQGSLVVTGGVTLRADIVEAGPPRDEFLRESELALASYLRALIRGAPGDGSIANPGTGSGRVERGPITDPASSRPYGPGARELTPRDLTEIERSLPAAPAGGPIFARSGVISFAAGELRLVVEGGEQVGMASGGVVLQYWDRKSGRTLQITAERAVVFLAPGAGERFPGPLDVDQVLGLYLEGGVQADGQDRFGRSYVLRSPRVYYDVANDRALLLDAVFWTYDDRRGLPLYVRAAAIRQESSGRFSATGALLTNTAFFSPHLSIGASSVTISRRERPDREDATIVDAKSILVEAMGVPIFYWPRFVGDPDEVPIEDFRVENSTGSGTALKLTLNAKSLLGIDDQPGLRSSLLADYYLDRGPALGTETSWTSAEGSGLVFAYGVADDRGTDLLSTGAEIERDGGTRGMALAEMRQKLDRLWTFEAEGAYISDEAFTDAFFEPLSRSRREFITALSLRRTDERSVLAFEASGSVNDFIANEYLLQSRGYGVEKLPEASYARLADDLLAGATPGLLSYSSEYRLGRSRLNFHEPTAAQTGFTGDAGALDALGVRADESVSDRLRAAGLSESAVLRFDTRHELSLQVAAGDWNVTPFAVGRLTAWDDDFAAFSPGEDDNQRWWGGAGVRAATVWQHVDESAESRLLDIHRLRHLVEPSLTLWHGATTVDRVDLPVYDERVESIAEGSAIRLGLDQTWQTQRGAPGRWRSVDVLTVDAELVVASDDADAKSPFGRWIDYRPELSNLGDYATLMTTWQVSESVALAGLTSYDFDLSQPSRSSAGVLVQHSPVFSSFGEVRFLNPEDSTYYIIGARYQLTRKYTLGGSATLDGDEARFQQASVELGRHFPNVLLSVGVTYNDILNETSLGFSVQPVGFGGRGARLRGLGSSQTQDRAGGLGG